MRQILIAAAVGLSFTLLGTPIAIRLRIVLSGRATSSRRAATGGMREALRAGP